MPATGSTGIGLLQGIGVCHLSGYQFARLQNCGGLAIVLIWDPQTKTAGRLITQDAVAHCYLLLYDVYVCILVNFENHSEAGIASKGRVVMPFAKESNTGVLGRSIGGCHGLEGNGELRFRGHV